MQDATHFKMRTVFSLGRIKGHLELMMEVNEASRPDQVGYRGQGIIAGSPLNFELGFHIAPADAMTEVQWRGEVKLAGPLVLMAGDLLDSMSRQNFERMAESLCRRLQGLSHCPSVESTEEGFEI